MAVDGAGMKYCWPQAPAPMPMHQPLSAASPDAWASGWQQASQAPVAPMATYAQAPAWRCMHGAMVATPTKPELRAADDSGYALLVQWPSVPNAVAYVVELRESGAMHAERFIRSVPQQVTGSLVELRIGGLRPAGSGQGRCYYAQVRSVTACGCES